MQCVDDTTVVGGGFDSTESSDGRCDVDRFGKTILYYKIGIDLSFERYTVCSVDVFERSSSGRKVRSCLLLQKGIVAITGRCGNGKRSESGGSARSNADHLCRQNKTI